MLRELSSVLLDIHDGLDQCVRRVSSQGMTVVLTTVDVQLPLDIQPVFLEGQCVLRADVPRTHGQGDWSCVRSSVFVSWIAQPTLSIEGSVP